MVGVRAAIAGALLIAHAAGTVRPVWVDPGANCLGAPSLDGRYLSYVDAVTGDLAVRDLSTGSTRRLTHKPEGSREFAYFSAISPDSRQVAYAWFNDAGFYDLRVTALEGGAARVLFRNEEAGFVQPSAWSPDGKSILTLFFRKDNISQIALVSSADGSVRILKSLDWVYPKKMDFSPDGRFIVYDSFARNGSKERDIFVLSADGSRETVLVEQEGNDLFPVWMPDGRHVLFASDRDGRMDAWLVAVEDGRPQGPARMVRRDVGRFLPMGMTRAGAYFYGLRTGTTDVYVAELAEGKPGPPARVSGRIPDRNSAPVWAPDGAHLAYFSRRGSENFGQEARVICVRPLDGGEERELAPKLAHLERIAWSPDGRWLLASGSDRKSRGGLFRIDARTAAVTPIVQDDAASFRGYPGAWSRDGKSVYYGRSGEVLLRNLESGGETLVHQTGAAIQHLALSPDGRWLALGTKGVEILPAAGGTTRTIAAGEPNGIEWTRDSRHILVSRGGELWRVAVQGGPAVKLDLPGGGEGGVSLNPDGRRLAFTAGRTRSEVWVMEHFLPGVEARR